MGVANNGGNNSLVAGLSPRNKESNDEGCDGGTHWESGDDGGGDSGERGVGQLHVRPFVTAGVRKLKDVKGVPSVRSWYIRRWNVRWAGAGGSARREKVSAYQD
jgi:hypothetical protein